MNQPAQALKGAKVLVLEDNFVVAMDLEDELRSFGVDVVGAFASVEEARDAAQSTRPALAILDVRARDGSSIPLASELEADGVRCVFVTGYGAIPGLPPALAAVPRLTKPLIPRELHRALERLLLDGASERGTTRA